MASATTHDSSSWSLSSSACRLSGTSATGVSTWARRLRQSSITMLRATVNNQARSAGGEFSRIVAVPPGAEQRLLDHVLGA